MNGEEMSRTNDIVTSNVPDETLRRLSEQSIGITTAQPTASYCSCKYRLPCGYCELKKTECNWWQSLTIPCDYNKLNITPTWGSDLNEIARSVVEMCEE